MKVLAIGAHYDDIELGCSGTLIKHVQQGDKVTISSPHGAISREVNFEKHLSPGLIFVPMAFQDNNAKELLGLTPVGIEDSPGWKVVPVTLEKRKP